jgi:hypothetical protein
MKFEIAKRTIIMMSLVTLMSACGEKEAVRADRREQPEDAVLYGSLDSAGLTTFTLNTRLQFVDRFDAMMAISESGLGRSVAAQLAIENATSPGVLPQILVPSVRQEIASNSMLGILQSLPFGIGSSLLNIFATDQKLAENIREGLGEKLTQGLAQYGGSSLGSRLAYNFDHFSRSPANGGTFDIVAQAGRWNLVWSEDGLWTGGVPLDGRDHGLQLLGVLRTLSEWSYLFGIGTGGNLSGFGGLTKQWKNGILTTSVPLAPSDPLISSQLVTGSYEIAVPMTMSALDLATRGGEQWRSQISAVPLLEQASVWLSGAKAFARLRADSRRFSSDLFTGMSPVLSSNVSLLPLLFLNNMGSMLDGAFINTASQKIFNEACPTGNCELADARSVARMAMAVAKWDEAISNSATAGVDADVQAKLSAAAPKLKLALQLATRTMTGDLTEDSSVGDRRWLTVHMPSTPDLDPSTVSAEVIGTLAYIERNILNSDTVKERIQALANGHAATYFHGSGSIKTGESLLWNARMIRELELSKFGDTLPWLDKAKESFKQALAGDWVDP